EAMTSGLPTFASQFGGPSEIIEDNVNGFLINPTHLEETAARILHFLDQCEIDPQYWEQISERAIHRVRDRYSWDTHTTKLWALANLFWFWNQIAPNNREALFRYLELMFQFMYKSRAANLLQETVQQAT
ncbi:MAG TPA: glycosyltransferase, partial [Stenomitos sp.]